MRKNIILYAEDNRKVRESMLSLFAGEFPNYTFEIFPEGVSLERRLDGNIEHVCAVVTDNSMPPGISGLDIIKKYGSKLKIPFILYYGNPNEKIGEEAVAQRAYDYVLKPDFNKLIEIMRTVLNKKPNLLSQ